MILTDLIAEFFQLTVHLVGSPAPIIVVGNIILELSIPTQFPQRVSAGGICHRQSFVKLEAVLCVVNTPKERGI
jgi:hypothetical protein